MEDNKRKNIPLSVMIGGVDVAAPAVKEAFTTPEGVVETVVFILNTLVGLSALVAVIMIVVSGYMFITAGGDSDKVKSAGNTITSAVIGLAIVFLARTIIVFLIENVIHI